MADESLRYILAQNIRNRRKKLRLTQAKLAELSELSESHINELERCITWIGEESLQKIARSLHMQPYELLLPLEIKSAEAIQKIKKSKDAYSIMDSTKQELYKQIDKTVDYAIRQVTAMYEATENINRK